MNDSSAAAPSAAPPPAAVAAPPSAAIAAIITALVVVALVPWFLIGGRFIDPLCLVGGVLVAWFWLNLEQAVLARAPHTLLGAIVGIGLAWLPLLLAARFGTAGLLIGLGAMIVAIFLDIIAVVPIAVNKSTMLFLTVAAAPIVQLRVDFPQLIASTLIGGLYFIAFTEVVKRVAARRG